MNCKNCGAKIKSDMSECPNCGAPCNADNGYVLLSGDNVYDDYYSYDEKPSKGKKALKIIAVVVIIAAVAAGVLYFTGLYEKIPFLSSLSQSDVPELTFDSGSGVINDDEKIIYVTVNEDSKIQYIHGVKLYAYSKTDSSQKVADEISTDYEYTKSVGGVIRAIYFDTDKLGIEEDKNYTYTFEMEFQFYDSDSTYVYDEIVNFSGKIEEDVSSIVFDHSMNTTVSSENSESEKTTDDSESEETTEKTTAESESSTSQINTAFLQNSFWFTAPVTDDDEYSIRCIKFNSDSSCTFTDYKKSGSSDWSTSTSSGSYTVENDTLTVTDADGNETSYSINSDYSSVSDLTSRRYNSVKNVEDFFGM